MERKALLEDVKSYFVSSDHWRRLCASLVDPDPTGTHIHSYVETSVHPESLETLIKGYFELLGTPSTRKIDHMAPKAGMGSLHGIEPLGCPHFDYQWFFNKDVGLRALESGESGCNLLIWNRTYINRFYKQFPFRTVGTKEEKAVEAYFKSEHFLKGLTYPVMPTTNHMHINIHTSVQPYFIQKYAEDAFKREGITIFYTCPNVYMVNGKYRGKLVFMSKNPECVFDIGWKFDPSVVIEPAMEPWIFKEEPGYDVWTQAMMDDVLKGGVFVRLTDDEIHEILQACKCKL